MKFKVQESMTLDDGKYEGIIESVEYRETPYEYTDLRIAITGTEGQHIKVGYPTYISPTSGLGRLLERMGSPLQIGKEVDPEDVLIGTAISFVVVNEASKKDGKTYARVVADSVKSAHTITKEKFPK